jgi:hypothetical protein
MPSAGPAFADGFLEPLAAAFLAVFVEDFFSDFGMETPPF